MTDPFKEFPLIHTARLSLRQLNLTDAEEVLFLRSDKEVNKFIKRQTPTKIQDAIAFVDKIQLAYIKKESISWVICLRAKPKMIGSICLWNFSTDRKTAEVGYDLHPSFQNKGIMTEALKEILHLGFQRLDLDHVKAYTHRLNENSKNLLIKNGFVLIKEETDPDNEDNLIFSISKG